MPENIPFTDPSLSIPALVLALLGLGLLIAALTRLLRRRLLSSAFHGGMACVFFASAAVLFLLAMNLHSYQRLSYEQAIAEVSFSQIGPQRFKVKILMPGTDHASHYELFGDEWQLDARIVKWKSPATLLGLDARYRLERLSGRYRNIEQERSASRSVHALARDEGLDLWTVLGRLKEYLPWIDAYYGSATYLPMADNAHYQITLSQSGLLTRPINDEGDTAVKQWY